MLRRAIYSLLTKKTNSGIAILIVYVDDKKVTGDDAEAISDLKKQLREKLDRKYLGKLNFWASKWRDQTVVFDSLRGSMHSMFYQKAE